MPAFADATRAYLDRLAKPPGSLGGLEDLAVFLAGAQRRHPPRVDAPRVIIFAGDHAVAEAQGTSPYPSAVTVAMVHTICAGKAAVAALARQAGATVEVVDVGVRERVRVSPQGLIDFIDDKVAPGAADLSVGPALTDDQRALAMEAGARAVARALARGADLLCFGEMGIGNTTPASAVAARLLGRPAADLVGPGTGLDAAGVAHKASVVQRALDRGGPTDPLGALADLGGLEIAALTGAMLAAEERSVPVLVDGFIVSAAALVAVRVDPGVRRVLYPATRSAEPGHGLVLEALGLGRPLLDLGLRLGEASAATAAIPLARSACALVEEMALLEEVLAQAE